MLAVARSGAGRLTVHLGHCRKGAGGGIGKAAGVVGGAENRIVRDQRRVVRGVEHRAIGRMDDPARVEGGGEVAVIARGDRALEQWRSEEHTSELQSLMRISYAVFCLKKKNTHSNVQIQPRTRIHNLYKLTPNNITHHY